MKTRPWPIVILAILQFLAPFVSIGFCSFQLGATPWEYVLALWQESTWVGLAFFFGLGPLAGIAIYRVRPWSYPVFLAITGFTAIQNFQSWKMYPDYLSVPLLALGFLANAAVVGYFLHPTVWTAYFNRRVRWWDTEPRLKVSLPAVAFGRPVTILNLSSGGALIRSETSPRVIRFPFRFTCGGERFETEAKLAHGKVGEQGTFGVKFANDPVLRARLRIVLKEMESRGLARAEVRVPWTRDLKEWMLRLLRTGRGWLPEIQLPK